MKQYDIQYEHIRNVVNRKTSVATEIPNFTFAVSSKNYIHLCLTPQANGCYGDN